MSSGIENAGVKPADGGGEEYEGAGKVLNKKLHYNL